MEVLVAFTILLSGLTLVAAGFSRGLFALQLLQKTLIAHRLADHQMIRETLRREQDLEIPADATPHGDFSVQVSSDPFPLEPEPVRDLVLDQAVAQVSFSIRGQDRRIELTAGFPHEEEGPEGSP